MTRQDNCQQGRAVRKDRPARRRGIWPELFSPAVAPDRLMIGEGGRAASPGTCPVPNRSTGQHHCGLYHKSLRKTACFGAMAGLGRGGRAFPPAAGRPVRRVNRILTVGVERKPELAGVGGNGCWTQARDANRRRNAPNGAGTPGLYPFRCILAHERNSATPCRFGGSTRGWFGKQVIAR